MDIMTVESQADQRSDTRPDRSADAVARRALHVDQGRRSSQLESHVFDDYDDDLHGRYVAGDVSVDEIKAELRRYFFAKSTELRHAG